MKLAPQQQARQQARAATRAAAARGISIVPSAGAARGAGQPSLWQRSITDLFIHQAGTTEVPPQYVKWMAHQFIAAMVADRVYVEIFKGLPLAPNLYTVLLGPSGIGKGLAIREATKFTRAHPIVGTYEAAVTAKAIVDKLANSTGTLNEEGEALLDAPYLFLVTPELAMSVGSGRLADEFVKMMTQLFEGNFEMAERTRMHGEFVVKNACVNWAAGTTREWAVKSISIDAVTGGFFARCATVTATYPDKMVWEPKYPRDRQQVIDHLHERAAMLLQTRGEIRVTPEADAIGRAWYENRAKPSDSALYAVHQRERALMMKVAAILVLGEIDEPNPKKLQIRQRHMIAAQKLCREVWPAASELVSYASTTPETRGLDEVRTLIKEAKLLKHSVLVSKMASRGVGKQHLDNLLNILQHGGHVVRAKLEGSNARFWQWKKSSAKLEEADPVSAEEEAALVADAKAKARRKAETGGE